MLVGQCHPAAVIAVARNGQRISKKIGDIELLPGDVLLLEAHPEFIESQRNNRDFFLVSRVENSTPPRHDRAWAAQLILVGMIAAVVAGLSMLKASMLAAGMMLITRCCRGSEARRAVDLSVLLAIGAGLGIGEAMKASGAPSGWRKA